VRRGGLICRRLQEAAGGSRAGFGERERGRRVREGMMCRADRLRLKLCSHEEGVSREEVCSRASLRSISEGCARHDMRCMWAIAWH